MKKRNYCTWLLTLAAGLLQAQNDSDHPITDLFVNRIETRFTLCGSLIGFGSTASLLGEGVVYPKSDASALMWNPAALAFLEKRSIVFDYVPGFLQDISEYVDVEGPVEEAMDDMVEESGTAQTGIGYPVIRPQVGFQSSVSGFGLAIPFRILGKPFGVGFGYSTPLLMDLEIKGTGIEAALDIEQELEGEMRHIHMRTWANLNALFQLRSNQFVIGLGGELFRGMALGASLQRYRIRAWSKAHASIDGIIEMSGSEYVFNDPYDPKIDFAGGEQNDLNQSFEAEFTGSGWGYKLGVVQRITRRFQIGLTYSVPPKMEITGLDSTVNNRIDFIKFEDGGGDGEGDGMGDLLDPTKINLSKLTLTQRDIDVNHYASVLELPSALNVGMVIGGGFFNLVLRYTKYEGGLISDIIDDKLRGMTFRMGAGLGLDFTYLYLGASVSLMDELRPADSEDEGEPLENIPFPKVNLGFRIPTFRGLWVDGLIGVEPVPLLRLTFRYDF